MNWVAVAAVGAAVSAVVAILAYAWPRSASPPASAQVPIVVRVESTPTQFPAGAETRLQTSSPDPAPYRAFEPAPQTQSGPQRQTSAHQTFQAPASPVRTVRPVEFTESPVGGNAPLRAPEKPVPRKTLDFSESPVG